MLTLFRRGWYTMSVLSTMAAIHVFSRQMAPGESYPSTGPRAKVYKNRQNKEVAGIGSVSKKYF